MPLLLIIGLLVAGFVLGPQLLTAGRAAGLYDRMLPPAPEALRFVSLQGTKANFSVELSVNNPTAQPLEIEYVAYDICLGRGGAGKLVQIRYDGTNGTPFSIPARRADARIALPFSVSLLGAAWAVATNSPRKEQPAPAASGKDNSKTKATHEDEKTGMLARLIAIVKDRKYPSAVYTTGDVKIKGISVPFRIEDYETKFSGA